jgi:hypothetical protein
MKRYYIVCNGFPFETSEVNLLAYLDTLNPTKRLTLREGIGPDQCFETVAEALVHFSRVFHNESAKRVQERNINAVRT